MTDFAPIAEALRDRMAADGTVAAAPGSVETNSVWVERRSAWLLDVLARDGGPRPVTGLDVADLGCGVGGIACYLAFQGARVVGVDANAERLAIGRDVAAAHGLDVRFVEGRLEANGLPDAAFDLALLNNSLCYVVDRAARAVALREVLRILRPGGRVVTRDPNRWTPRDQFTDLPLVHLGSPELARRLTRRLGRKRSVVRLTTPREAVRELREAGFADVASIVPLGTRHAAVRRHVSRYHHVVAHRPG